MRREKKYIITMGIKQWFLFRNKAARRQWGHEEGKMIKKEKKN